MVRTERGRYTGIKDGVGGSKFDESLAEVPAAKFLGKVQRLGLDLFHHCLRRLDLELVPARSHSIGRSESVRSLPSGR